MKEFYDPKTVRFPYPSQTDQHYLKVRKNRGLVFDEHYPYLDKRKGFRFAQALLRFVIHLIVFPLLRIRLGLRLEGKENLKKHRDVIENGIVSVSNHVHLWDYLCVMRVARRYHTNIPVWAPNINGETGKLMRLVGGIPIPEKNFKGTMQFTKAIDEVLQNKGWLHVYSEGSMWEYYRMIRPFKVGAAHFAVTNNKPILPLAFCYRKPNWLRRGIFGQITVFTVRIGEPIFPNLDLSMREAEVELTQKSHEAVCALAGLKPGENVYEPLFHSSHRVDYYSDTYGIGYKGSH